MLFISAFWRPLWRDEVWALYYSDINLGLGAITDRLFNNVHPPIYFYILHFWRGVFDNIIWYKILNIAFIIFSFLGIYFIGRDKKQTIIFLLLAIGNFWLIYYAGIVRPYALMFALGAICVFILSQIFANTKDGKTILFWLLLWIVAGAAFSLSHYFAGLFIGFCGLLTGIWFLSQKKPVAFLAIGFASALAVLPCLLWIYFSYDKIGFVNNTPPTTWDNFLSGQNQFWRGVIKFLFSNPPAFLLAIIGIFAAIKNKNHIFEKLLLASIILTIISLFLLHMFWQPLIKERSMMIIIAAILFLSASGLAKINAGKISRLIPIFTIIMPFLYFGEYFKDREKLGDVRKYTSVEPCEGAPIFVYYRSFPEGEEFGNYYLRFALPYITAIEAHSKNKQELPNVLASACPVKALALVMPRGERAEHNKARNAFMDAGLNRQKHLETKLGKGRNILWLEKK